MANLNLIVAFPITNDARRMLRGNCGQSIFLANDEREALNMKSPLP